MRITFVPMVAMIVSTLLHVPLCILFVEVFDMDIRGLGAATSVNKFLLIFFLMVYGSCSKNIRPAMTFPDRDTFRGWCEYLQVALPVTAMYCAEVWAFEILVLIAGTLSVSQQAAQVILLSYVELLIMVALGIQETASGIFGNCIGANNVPLAKLFFTQLTKISLSVTLMLSLITFFARHQIAWCFTENI